MNTDGNIFNASDLNVLRELCLQNNKVLTELQSSVTNMHTKLDSAISYHEQRLGICFNEIKEVKGRMQCEVRQANIEKLTNDRRWLTERMDKQSEALRSGHDRITALEAKVDKNAEQYAEQEARYKAAIKWVFGLLTIVAAAAVIGLFKSHWKP